MGRFARAALTRNCLPGAEATRGCTICSSPTRDRKSTRLNSSHLGISYAVFCLKNKNTRLNSSHLGRSYSIFGASADQEHHIAYPRHLAAAACLRPTDDPTHEAQLDRESNS